jgi:hypothetical protein
MITRAVGPREISTCLERRRDGHGDFTREMIVTGTGQPKRSRLAGELRQMKYRDRAGQMGQAFDHRRHSGSGQAVITVAAFRRDREQAALDQLGEMTARRRRADPRRTRQFAGRPGAAVEQDGQNGRPARLAEKRADPRDVWFNPHSGVHSWSLHQGIKAGAFVAQFARG